MDETIKSTVEEVKCTSGRRNHEGTHNTHGGSNNNCIIGEETTISNSSSSSIESADSTISESSTTMVSKPQGQAKAHEPSMKSNNILQVQLDVLKDGSNESSLVSFTVGGGRESHSNLDDDRYEASDGDLDPVQSRMNTLGWHNNEGHENNNSNDSRYEIRETSSCINSNRSSTNSSSNNSSSRKKEVVELEMDDSQGKCSEKIDLSIVTNQNLVFESDCDNDDDEDDDSSSFDDVSLNEIDKYSIDEDSETNSASSATDRRQGRRIKIHRFHNPEPKSITTTMENQHHDSCSTETNPNLTLPQHQKDEVESNATQQRIQQAPSDDLDCHDRYKVTKCLIIDEPKTDVDTNRLNIENETSFPDDDEIGNSSKNKKNQEDAKKDGTNQTLGQRKECQGNENTEESKIPRSPPGLIETDIEDDEGSTSSNDTFSKKPRR